MGKMTENQEMLYRAFLNSGMSSEVAKEAAITHDPGIAVVISPRGKHMFTRRQRNRIAALHKYPESSGYKVHYYCVDEFGKVTDRECEEIKELEKSGKDRRR